MTATAASGWTYTTVVADVAKELPIIINVESAEMAWVPEEEVADRPLHPGFAAAWPSLRAESARLELTGLADPGAVAAALPRTVDLAHRGFLWLHTADDGGRPARIGTGNLEPADDVLLLTLDQLMSAPPS